MPEPGAPDPCRPGLAQAPSALDPVRFKHVDGRRIVRDSRVRSQKQRFASKTASIFGMRSSSNGEQNIGLLMRRIVTLERATIATFESSVSSTTGRLRCQHDCNLAGARAARLTTSLGARNANVKQLVMMSRSIRLLWTGYCGQAVATRIPKSTHRRH